MTATTSPASGTAIETRPAGRFAQVAKAVKENLGIAVDLVMVHNEHSVRGLQPRTSLNRAIVVTAVGAWDRFIADTRSAFTANPDDENWYTGGDKGIARQLYALPADTVLTEAGALQTSYRQTLDISAATGWAGVKIKSLEDLIGTRAGTRSGLTFDQHLNQWIGLRNGLAHGSLRHLLTTIDNPQRWKSDPQIGDPYASELRGRYRLWASDAPGDSTVPDEHRLVGATVQAGGARTCLALIVQLIDGIIIDICRTDSRDWDTDTLRLPQAWFDRQLPTSFRGATSDGYAHWTLWGGPRLRRRP